MTNPYPANFEALDGSRRLTGQVNFTDPANQPSGGAQTVLTHTVTLSSADILALNATTYDGPPLVAAPAAGTMIVPLSVLAVSHYGTTRYTPTSNNDPYVSTAAEYSSSNGGSWFIIPRCAGMVPGLSVAVIAGASVLDDDVSLAGVNGQPLGLFINTPLTGGDGTLDLTTFYYLADIS